MTRFHNTRLHLLWTLCCAGCVGSETTPTVDYREDNLCRCAGYRNHLAFIQIEAGAVPFHDTLAPFTCSRGMEYPATILRLLPTSLESPDAPPITSNRLQIRILNRHENGSICERLRLPVEMTFRPSTRLLIGLYFGRSDRGRSWYMIPLSADGSTGALAIPWYQFPVGTPVERVLDPAEWLNYERGCMRPCENMPFPPQDAAVGVDP